MSQADDPPDSQAWESSELLESNYNKFSHPSRVLNFSEKMITTSSDRHSSRALVTIETQKFFTSHERHCTSLKQAIGNRFGDRVVVQEKVGPSNAGFEVYLRILGSTRVTGNLQTAYSYDKRTERLLFSKIIEGFFPSADELLTVIDLSLANNRVVDRDLSKVQCSFIYSDPDHASIFKRLVNQATSQLIGKIRFEIQMVYVPDVLEVWLNGHLLYSQWSCHQPPVLHDIIRELQKASRGQQFETMPRLR